MAVYTVFGGNGDGLVDDEIEVNYTSAETTPTSNELVHDA